MWKSFSLRGHLEKQRLRSRLHSAVCRNWSKGNRVHAPTLSCQLSLGRKDNGKHNQLDFLSTLHISIEQVSEVTNLFNSVRDEDMETTRTVENVRLYYRTKRTHSNSLFNNTLTFAVTNAAVSSSRAIVTSFNGATRDFANTNEL